MVVPNGYTGSVRIMLDPDGQDIPLVGGRYRVVIPADGMLRVRSFDPFEQWHELSARYVDGSPLPQASAGNPAGPDTVALRGGGSMVEERGNTQVRWIFYFVGTEAQYRANSDTDFAAPGR